jgi:polysaccharide export outer membrane protein
MKKIMELFHGRSLLTFACACMAGLYDPLPALANDDYRLNPGDKLQIDVWQEENLKTQVVVLPDGTISFPLVGHVPGAGHTTKELRDLLVQQLSQFIPNPEVNVTLLAAEGNVVYIIGQVAKPGAYVMTRPLDVMQALSMAGGLTEFAGRNDIRILRREAGGRSKTLPFSYGEVEDGEGLESNIILQCGDTVIVP